MNVLECTPFLPSSLLRISSRHAAWIPAVNHSWAAHLPSGGPTLNICSKSEDLRTSAQMMTLFYSIKKQIKQFSFITISYCAYFFLMAAHIWGFNWLMQPESRCALLPVRLGCGCWLETGCVSWLRSVWPWYLWGFKIIGHRRGTSFLGVRCLYMELYLFQPEMIWWDLFKLG